MRSANIRIFVTLCSLIFLSHAATHAQEDSTRPFHLGFTPFPYVVEFNAVLDVYETIARDGDLIAQHFDNGVPWTEALNGEPYSDNILNDWSLRRSQTRDSQTVYLSVTPISISRDSLAPYRGEADDMPLPSPFDSYGFDHPDVMAAFLRYCEDAIAYFEPDYFVIGIEVNLLMKVNPQLWDTYMVLHRATYTALKDAHPDLPVMVSVTGIDLLEGYTDANHADQVRALEDILPYTDILGFSIYPYFTSYMTNAIPNEIYDQLAALVHGFDADMPLAVTETGYPAQAFSIDVGGGLIIDFEGTDALQADWMELTLQKADNYDFAFVINFVLRDYDAVWEMLGSDNTFVIAWRDTGLYAEDGRERPALEVWREWLAIPYASENGA